MQEPSVLDYVKSKIYFWRGDSIELPEAPEPDSVPLPEPDEEPAAPVDASAPPRPLPWRALLALLFGLIAQLSLEPPRNDPLQEAVTGTILFGLAIFSLIWAYQRGEWRLPDLTSDHSLDDALLIQRPWLIVIAWVLAAGSFFLFKDNLFTFWNVTLWLAAIFLYGWGLWQSQDGKHSGWRNLLTPWNALVLAAVVMVVFYRFYNLSGVLSEPFSDHIEKLYDVRDVLAGQTHIFFPRNTGREFIQMYVTVLVIKLLGTGLTFMSLKIGTVLIGLGALPFIYLLGNEIGGKRVALFAFFLAGIAYWPNVISRVGLRFPLYPLFTAPALYYMIRGLRRSNRNDFIWSGIFLGLGLHGYSSFRFVPIVVLIGFIIYALHHRDKDSLTKSASWLAIVITLSVIVFLPLLRYMIDHPQDVLFRAMTRLTSAESPLPGPAWEIFIKNFLRGITMFQWSNGEIWVHSIPFHPALDIVSGALLVLGVVLVLIRYARQRNWLDLFLLLSIPLLLMPSILSLAFPNENPSLNRTGGAIVPVFLVVAMALDGLVTGLRSSLSRRRGQVLALGVVAVLLFWSSAQNYDLVFRQFKSQYDSGVWNSSEMAAEVKLFVSTGGSYDHAWIVPYPYWVDTRLLSAQTGQFEHEFTRWREELPATVDIPGPKLFLLFPDDSETIDALSVLYPTGVLGRYPSQTPGRDFLEFRVP